MWNKHSRSRGYAALCSVIILAAVLTSLIFMSQQMAFDSRLNALESGYALQARQLAESCVTVARIRMLTSNAYMPHDDRVSLGQDASGHLLECTIQEVAILGGVHVVSAFATYREATVFVHTSI
jgi:hypothetical protein